MATRPPRAVTRLAAYLIASWGVLIALAASAGAALAVVASLAALYTTAPLVAFLARRGSWRRYPTAAFRLFVVRPALYAQLLLPIVASVALVGLLVVAFAHNPALWPALAERGAALTLSGHTHWGQFALPRRGWSLASPFLEHAMGGYQRGDALLYVHPGTGFWGVPFRIGAYPEVAAVTLRAAPAAGLAVGEARPAARRAA